MLESRLYTILIHHIYAISVHMKNIIDYRKLHLSALNRMEVISKYRHRRQYIESTPQMNSFDHQYCLLLYNFAYESQLICKC